MLIRTAAEIGVEPTQLRHFVFDSSERLRQILLSAGPRLMNHIHYLPTYSRVSVFSAKE